MSVDDHAFAARAAAITEACRGRLGRLQRELAEQQAAARARGRGHLHRMVGLADRKIQEITAAVERDPECGPTSGAERSHGVELGRYDRSWDEAPTATAVPKRTRARDLLGDDDESFSDRHWLH